MLRADTRCANKGSFARVTKPQDRRADAPMRLPKGQAALRQAMEGGATNVAAAEPAATSVPPAWLQLLLLAAPNAETSSDDSDDERVGDAKPPPSSKGESTMPSS
jgi:hypothetical protein